MTFSLLIIGIASPAWAQSSPEAAAEEATTTESAEAEIEKLPPPPQSLGQLTPERLMALRTYKSKRLQVRAETEYRGSSVATFTSMSYGHPHGLGTGVVVSDNISTFRTWGVYRGPQRLSTTDFLALAGADAEREALVTDIRRLRKNARRWYIGAGWGGRRLGWHGDRRRHQHLQPVQPRVLGGTMLTIGGLFGASYGSKAERLYKYTGAT